MIVCLDVYAKMEPLKQLNSTHAFDPREIVRIKPMDPYRSKTRLYDYKDI